MSLVSVSFPLPAPRASFHCIWVEPSLHGRSVSKYTGAAPHHSVPGAPSSLTLQFRVHVYCTNSPKEKNKAFCLCPYDNTYNPVSWSAQCYKDTRFCSKGQENITNLTDCSPFTSTDQQYRECYHRNMAIAVFLAGSL